MIFNSGVDNWMSWFIVVLGLFFYGVLCVCFVVGMFVEKYGLWNIVLELDYVVFLVVNVVVKFDVENCLFQIVVVEKELKGIQDVGFFVDKDQDGRCFGIFVGVGFVFFWKVINYWLLSR